ncbi:hypothetical protein SAMN05216370_0019 [Pseudomonas peli]|uniref:Lipoprotein n=1 Tax=Pseudomonas peli TaxID=592361 RepID=A0AB37ZDR6_9PSED|nr:hypothetical protein [Pseudomonas peli]NMZ71337.1 hypothetical protein [Pseudomonas peli]SCW89260.1 hypothetical protein SAMN05216370_0019 [Pseudomonas peli]
MKKILIAMMACVALAGCKDEGGDFVGVWKTNDKMAETITVTKVDGGYRAISKLGNEDMSFMDMEVKLVAESDTLLIREADKKKGLELADGKVTSHLRNASKTFTKVN